MTGLAQLLSLACLHLHTQAPWSVQLILLFTATAWGCYVAASYLTLASSEPCPPGWTWLVAITGRLLLPGLPPVLSDDLYRYLWEGHVGASGFNPFVLSPDHPALASFRDGIYALVNHKHIPSVYPPVAQLSFRTMAEINYHPLSAQLVATFADITTLVILAAWLRRRNLPPGWLLLYAWNPLPILEFSWSGHIDAVAITLLLWGLYLVESRPMGATLALTLSALTKFLAAPLVAIVLHNRHGRKLMVLAIFMFGVAWIPFVEPALFTGLHTYARDWSYNSSIFNLLTLVISPPAARGVVGVLWLTLVGWQVVRGDPVVLGQVATGAFFLLSPTAHPWYLCWTLPFVVFRPSRAWILLSGLVIGSYWTLTTLDPLTGRWTEPPWLVWVEYLPFGVVLGLEWTGVLKPLSPGPGPDSPPPPTTDPTKTTP